jgi:iron transport multicopper oxidase
VDPTGSHAVLHYKGASAAEPTAPPDPQERNPLLEHLLVPLENPGAPGGSAPATRIIDLQANRSFVNNELEVGVFFLRA